MLPRPWDSPGKNTGVGCHFLLQSMKVKSESEVAQSYPTLSDPMDCSLPGSSVHGIFQARALEWGAIAFSDIYMYMYIYIYVLIYNICFSLFGQTLDARVCCCSINIDRDNMQMNGHGCVPRKTLYKNRNWTDLTNGL